jgi:cation diffusion facilitator CzcD-associated flavoprotein CzcO
LIGSSASGVDISRDIATAAKEVHIAARTFVDGTLGKQAGYDNLWLHPMVKILSNGDNWVAIMTSYSIDITVIPGKFDLNC